MIDEFHGREVVDEPPPFLNTWKRVYLTIVVYLGGLIAVMYWFSRTWR